MKKFVNGESKQVYEVTVDLNCSCDDNAGEKIAEIVEKYFKKKDIFDYDISFSHWRVEIALTDRRDCFNAMTMLQIMMEEKETKINKFKVTVSTF